MLTKSNTYDICVYILIYILCIFTQSSTRLKLTWNFQVQLCLIRIWLLTSTWKFSGFLDVDLKGKSEHLLCKSALSGPATRLAFIKLKAWRETWKSRCPGWTTSLCNVQHCTGAPFPNGDSNCTRAPFPNGRNGLLRRSKIFMGIFMGIYIYIYIYIYIFVHYILKLNLDIFVKLSSRLSRISKCLPRGKSQKHKWEFIKSKDNVLYCCVKHHNDMISTHFAHKEKAQRCSQVLEFAHSRD